MVAPVVWPTGGYNRAVRLARLGLDWGRVSDQTIAIVGNNQHEVLDWFAYPDSTALMALLASGGSIGEILFA
jgi:hypothetical protein